MSHTKVEITDIDQQQSLQAVLSLNRFTRQKGLSLNQHLRSCSMALPGDPKMSDWFPKEYFINSKEYCERTMLLCYTDLSSRFARFRLKKYPFSHARCALHDDIQRFIFKVGS